MADVAGPDDSSSAAGRGLTVGFVARAALTVIGLLGLANMLWLGRDVVFLAFFAVLAASFLSVFVDPLNRLGVPRILAAVVVLLVTLAVLAALAVLAWPTLQAQLAVIRVQFPDALAEVGGWFEAQYEAIIGQFGAPNDGLRQELQARLTQELAEVVSGAVPLVNTVVGTVAGLLILIFAGLYLAVEPGAYARGLALLVPPHGRDRVRDALHGVGGALRRWMLGTVISMVIIGGLTTLGLTLVGMPAALALGLIAGLLEFIPIVGPILSAVPAMAVALTISPVQALWVALLYLGIQQVESNVIHPLIMKGVVELPPALTILFQALMAVLFGFLGLLLAVPALAAAKTLTEMLYVEDDEVPRRETRAA